AAEDESFVCRSRDVSQLVGSGNFFVTRRSTGQGEGVESSEIDAVSHGWPLSLIWPMPESCLAS
ncbi:MAG: hypothetical protein FWD50_05390, partial [Betaproteobacteria bacterium]|nr:hypothetical protein [Betaproteobacteria bacterium]